MATYYSSVPGWRPKDTTATVVYVAPRQTGTTKPGTPTGQVSYGEGGVVPSEESVQKAIETVSAQRVAAGLPAIKTTAKEAIAAYRGGYAATSAQPRPGGVSTSPSTSSYTISQAEIRKVAEQARADRREYARGSVQTQGPAIPSSAFVSPYTPPKKTPSVVSPGGLTKEQVEEGRVIALTSGTAVGSATTSNILESILPVPSPPPRTIREASNLSQFNIRPSIEQEVKLKTLQSNAAEQLKVEVAVSNESERLQEKLNEYKNKIEEKLKNQDTVTQQDIDKANASLEWERKKYEDTLKVFAEKEIERSEFNSEKRIRDIATEVRLEREPAEFGSVWLKENLPKIGISNVEAQKVLEDKARQLVKSGASETEIYTALRREKLILSAKTGAYGAVQVISEKPMTALRSVGIGAGIALAGSALGPVGGTIGAKVGKTLFAGFVGMEALRIGAESTMFKRTEMFGRIIGETTPFLVGGLVVSGLTRKIPISKRYEYKTFKTGRTPSTYQSRTYAKTIVIQTKEGAREYLFARQEFPSVYQRYTTPARKLFGLSPKETLIKKGMTYKYLGQYDIGEKYYSGGYRVSKLSPYAKMEKIYQVRGITPGGEKFEKYILRRMPSVKGYESLKPTEFESILKLKKVIGKKEVFIYTPTEKLITKVYGAGKIKPYTAKGYIPATKVRVEQVMPGQYQFQVGLKQVKWTTFEPGVKGKVSLVRGRLKILSPGETSTFQIITPAKTPEIQRVALDLLKSKGGNLFSKPAFTFEYKPVVKTIPITAPGEITTTASTAQALKLAMKFPAPIQLIQKAAPTFAIPSLNFSYLTASAALTRFRAREQARLAVIPKLSLSTVLSQFKITQDAAIATTPTTKFSSGQAPASVQLQQSTQIPSLIQPTKLSVKLGLGVPTPPSGFQAMTIPIPPVERGSLFRAALQKIKARNAAYDVYVQRSGKYRKVADDLPLGRAKKKGADITSTTLASQFKVVLDKKASTSQEDISYEPSSTLFRKYRVSRGRQVPLPQGPDVYQYIELKRKRLTTGGERREIKVFQKLSKKRSKKRGGLFGL